MSKREMRIQRYSKLGLISSMLSALSGVGALVLILPRWFFSENIIDIRPDSKRIIPVGLALFLTLVLGFLGLLAGLEGAANGQGKFKAMGWVGFWIGILSTMLGLVLGLCFYFYRV